MLDLKTFKSALEQLEEERKIPKEKILDAIEQAMAAAYKKDYGKKGQIIRAKFDLETGKTDFFKIKIVVDETIARQDEEEVEKDDERVLFNPEHPRSGPHIHHRRIRNQGRRNSFGSSAES